MRRKPLTLQQRVTYRSIEDVIGCKWSAAILGALSHGVTRPGELEHYIPGLTTKVLNERLRRLREYGLITRTAHEGFPLRVDYALTEFGQRAAQVIEELQALNTELARAAEAERGRSPERARR